MYSFGVGHDIEWDLAMIQKFGVTVHAFDPTPRSINWVRNQRLPERFRFHEYGVADCDGSLTLFAPRRPSSFHYSSIRRSLRQDARDVISAPVYRLSTIMRMLGHDHIDVLKMDIEGAEYGVINDIVESGISVGQFLLEFHHNFRGVGARRTVKAVSRLRSLGFEVFHISDRSYEMSLIHCDALSAPAATPAAPAMA